MSTLSEQIYDALYQKPISYDRTIQMIITAIIDEDKGIYMAEYSGGEVKVYSAIGEASFKAKDKVLVKIPEGDFSNIKLIEYKIDDNEDIDKTNYLSNQYSPISPAFNHDLIGSDEEESDTIDKDILSSYLRNAQYLKFRAEFQIIKPIEYDEWAFNISVGNTIKQFSSKDFIGNAFEVGPKQVQEAYFPITKEDLDASSIIVNLWNVRSDSFVDYKFSLQFVNKVAPAVDANYLVCIADDGFAIKDGVQEQVTIRPHVYYNGKLVENGNFFFICFIERNDAISTLRWSRYDAAWDEDSSAFVFKASDIIGASNKVRIDLYEGATRIDSYYCSIENLDHVSICAPAIDEKKNLLTLVNVNTGKTFINVNWTVMEAGVVYTPLYGNSYATYAIPLNDYQQDENVVFYANIFDRDVFSTKRQIIDTFEYHLTNETEQEETSITFVGDSTFTYEPSIELGVTTTIIEAEGMEEYDGYWMYNNKKIDTEIDISNSMITKLKVLDDRRLEVTVKSMYDASLASSITFVYRVNNTDFAKKVRCILDSDEDIAQTSISILTRDSDYFNSIADAQKYYSEPLPGQIVYIKSSSSNTGWTQYNPWIYLGQN